MIQNTNFILVIKGVSISDYEGIRSDLESQFKQRGIEPPFFCYLPSDYAEIETLWIDEDMEMERFRESLQQTSITNVVNTTSKDAVDDFRAMEALAGV